MNEKVIKFPEQTVFTRWAKRFPLDDIEDWDPREGQPCSECGTTFAWYGYDGLCGWCWEDRNESA